MKNLKKLAVLSLGAAFVSTVAHAQSLENGDLILGFTSQSATANNDFVVDLGPIPGAPNTTLPTSGYDATAFASSFAAVGGVSALDSGAVNVGIVGGVNNGGLGDFIYTSVLDNGSGTATVPGSVAPVGTKSSTFLDSAADELGNLTPGSIPAATGFTGSVAENPSTAGTSTYSFATYAGANPLTTIPAGVSSILLDIYQDTSTSRTGASGFDTYVGDVLVNITDSGMTATFDPVAAPEPSTYALLAGGGLLAFALRRQFVRKNA
jgi:hypothetical protein